MEILMFILIFISTVLSWIDFRKAMRLAQQKEERSRAVVRFLLAVILFLIAIIVFLF